MYAFKAIGWNKNLYVNKWLNNFFLKLAKLRTYCFINV